MPDSVEVQLELKGSETKSFWWNSSAGKFLEGDKRKVSPHWFVRQASSMTTNLVEQRVSLEMQCPKGAERGKCSRSQSAKDISRGDELVLYRRE